MTFDPLKMSNSSIRLNAYILHGFAGYMASFAVSWAASKIKHYIFPKDKTAQKYFVLGAGSLTGTGVGLGIAFSPVFQKFISMMLINSSPARVVATTNGPQFQVFMDVIKPQLATLPSAFFSIAGIGLNCWMFHKALDSEK